MSTHFPYILFFFGIPFLCAWGSLILLIPRLKEMKMSQMILECGPKWHKSKEGTPTMGGLALGIAGLTVSLLSFLLPGNEMVIVRLTLFFAVGCGAVGIIDDLTKFRHKRNDGLTPIQKLILQAAVSAAFLAFLVMEGKLGTVFSFPVFGWEWNAGFWVLPISFLFILGSVNFANFTDGIDGLAAAVNLMIGLFFAGMGIIASNRALFCVAFVEIACAIAFLFFNYHPAQVFMGDTGSLFFGGLSIGCAFLSGHPWLLIPVGIVYYLEGASVILQVLWFKLSHGKRLFKMAPFHHHLEKSGWSEEKIVFVFFSATLLISFATLLMIGESLL